MQVRNSWNLSGKFLPADCLALIKMWNKTVYTIQELKRRKIRVLRRSVVGYNSD